MGWEKNNSMLREQIKKRYANKKTKLFCGKRVKNNVT